MSSEETNTTSGRPSMSFLDTSMFQDVTRSVDNLCNQFSITSIKVPRFDVFNDVCEFFTEFETVTSTLSDKQKLLIIGKAFPQGCHRSWYEDILKKEIAANKPWSSVKSTIYKRFADSEDQDRYFVKLRELKYDPEANKPLLDFIDDLYHAYKRAYPSEDNQLTIIRYMKAAIPKETKLALNAFPEFRNAKTEETLKDAIKHYDQSCGFTKKSDINKSEITKMFKEMFLELKKDVTESRQAFTAAIKTQEEKLSQVTSNYLQLNDKPMKYESPRYNRSPSPAYDKQRYARSPNRYGQNYRRSDSPQYHNDQHGMRDESARRYRSPVRYNRSPVREHPVPNRPSGQMVYNDNSKQQNIFDAELYLSKFGRPPSPCAYCGAWHWSKHCPMNLKE